MLSPCLAKWMYLNNNSFIELLFLKEVVIKAKVGVNFPQIINGLLQKNHSYVEKVVQKSFVIDYFKSTFIKFLSFNCVVNE